MLSNDMLLGWNGGTVTLKKVNQDGYTSEFRKKLSGEEFRAFVRHSVVTDKKRNVKVDRHNVEIAHSLDNVDPTKPPLVKRGYFVIETDVGAAAGGILLVAEALIGPLGDDSWMSQLENWES